MRSPRPRRSPSFPTQVDDHLHVLALIMVVAVFGVVPVVTDREIPTPRRDVTRSSENPLSLVRHAWEHRDP
ncbi:hypothetical protein [Streptosporangium saharense]|uniref:hypothetical protein n=1 Tax=Streptosporangium saharense TaxID=1706840 RepID=UPI003329AE24